MNANIKLWPQDLPMYLPISVLALQTAIPLLIRYSRRPNTDESSLYHPASVALLAELCKCTMAFGFIYRTTKGRLLEATSLEALIATACKFTEAIWSSSTLLVPALMYFTSNITAMYALSYLRSYIFTAIMNLRIVFAALLSITLLRKSITVDQWRAITIIFCAATVLCLEDMKTDEDVEQLGWTKDSFGMFIAVGAALVSAIGGVLVEKYLNTARSATPHPPLPPLASGLKSDGDERIMSRDWREQHKTYITPLQLIRDEAKTSSLVAVTLWEQQAALAFFSAVVAILYVVVFLQDAVRSGRVLQGWTKMTVLVMILQAVQGILVAVTIQRSGIVFRLIIGTISICLCILIESLLFFEPITLCEILNIVMVIVGSNMYSKAMSSPQPSSFGGSGGTNR